MSSKLNSLSKVATPGTSPLKSGRTTVNISTAFHPSLSTDLGLPNIVLVSTDEVHFYIHAQRILQKSTNRMDALIPSDVGQIIQSGQVVVTTGDTAAVLNVILHAIYEWPCTTFAPTFDSIEAATARLETYGVSLKDCLAPEKPLRVLLLNHTSIRPMEIYAMAAFNGLEEFAVVVSSHLLAYRLTTLSDELAVRMGARYLYRLAVLHHNRMEKLKKLVLSAPDVHATTDTCSFMQQKDLTGVWALASAHLSWEATPGMTLFCSCIDLC